MTQKNYSILLYYCYTTITEAEKFREAHHLFCIQNNIRGRIIVAKEGLNGAVSGLHADCALYMEHLKNEAVFADFSGIDFKIETHDTHTFEKINVRLKDEIVYSSLADLNPNEKTGIHLAPKDFKKMKDEQDVVILDVRSNYEHKLGKFKNAVTLDMENFREFPEKVAELSHLKDKKIITYCTGGIKCEKASAFLLEQGFENVYQLHGGIIKYGIEAGGEDFEGKCYVFDNRIAVDVNSVNPSVASTCYVCGTSCSRMVNCANAACNKHLPVCESCGWTLEGACSVACQMHAQKRPYDGTGYYARKPNGYSAMKGWKITTKNYSENL